MDSTKTGFVKILYSPHPYVQLSFLPCEYYTWEQSPSLSLALAAHYVAMLLQSGRTLKKLDWGPSVKSSSSNSAQLNMQLFKIPMCMYCFCVMEYFTLFLGYGLYILCHRNNTLLLLLLKYACISNSTARLWIGLPCSSYSGCRQQ